MFNNPLNDRLFLSKLDKRRYKEIYARITLLTFEETPIEYIEGRVTGGSINFDGASTLRRSCNISMVSHDLNINIYYLGLERKFILELGVFNDIDNNYPEIIWFPMGTYVTSNFTTARNSNSYIISILGKDKTCLLNGDISGNLPSSVDFGTLEEVSEDGKTITYTKVKIKDIIFNLIETYGNEMPHNIIINDIKDKDLELLEYRGTKPVYLFYTPDLSNLSHDFKCENFTLDGKTIVKNKDGISYTLESIVKEKLDYPISSIVDKQTDNSRLFYFKDRQTYIVKIEYGDCIGYRETDLVYAGDLIANVNDTITSVLDKIKTMLGDYEYFYNTKGQFVFQKKKLLYAPAAIGKDDNTYYYDNNKIESNVFYNFEDNELIISINNTPNLLNAKNDYSLWGTRKTVSGGEVPIHLRYAIDLKPTYYKTYFPKNITVVDDDYNYQQWTFIKGEDGSYEIDFDKNIITCDWREIIYLMASDYHKYKDLNEDFFFLIMDNNKQENYEGELESLYPTGKTGYELYYTDILGFWRDIFTPTDIYNGNKNFYKLVLLTEKLYKRNYYYTKSQSKKELFNRFPKYTLCDDFEYDDNKIYYEIEESVGTDTESVDTSTEPGKAETASNFHSSVINDPSILNFWFDFLDTAGELNKYAVKTIGLRSKCVNDNKITSIYYRPVPNLIFETFDEKADPVKLDRKMAYTYVNSSAELENCFVTGTLGKNAWEEALSYLNSFAKCTELLSFTAIPVYYLLPNVRISLKDEFSNMAGEYLVDKISFNLSYNGTMSVTATKIFDDIY